MSTPSFLKKAKQIQEDHQRAVEEPPKPPADDESNWLVSYADMMTLLCGFFIMLFSMAKLDESKYDSFKEALSKQFGGEYVSPTKELARFATEILQELGIEREAIVKTDPLGVSVVFESTLFFDSLNADVRVQGQKILTSVAEKMLKRQGLTGKNYKVVVEGHTDQKPIVGGNYPSNWELSGARAARVVRLFLDRGYKAENLAAIGYGDTRPQVAARKPSGEWDDQALAKNRRVVLRFLEPSVSGIPYPESAIEPPATRPAIQATSTH